MNSYLTDDFRACFALLPEEVKKQAQRNYQRWKKDPHHPGLRFKRVHPREPLYSVRVGQGWRAIGLREGDSITWFWIGSHADYETLLSRL